MSITPERLAAIRALGGDEFRDVLVMDDAVEELLCEVDELRGVARWLGQVLRSAQDRLDQGAPPDLDYLRLTVTAIEGIVRGWQV